MRLAAPRIAPLTDAEMDAAQKGALASMAGRPVLNIFRTLARAPEALSAFLSWGSYVLSKNNSLPSREREIVVLRIGYLCKAGYEWTQHVPIGMRAGITAEEIERLKAGAEAGWSAPDAALIRATDELHADHFISDATFAELRRYFSERQVMDLVFTAGQYTQVCMMLNTFGVPLDAGQTLDPDLKGF